MWKPLLVSFSTSLTPPSPSSARTSQQAFAFEADHLCRPCCQLAYRAPYSPPPHTHSGAELECWAAPLWLHSWLILENSWTIKDPNQVCKLNQMAQFTFINKENKSLMSSIIHGEMLSPCGKFLCFFLTHSLGQMGVGDFTRKFEAAEPRAWAPFTHFNMNSYCSCLNSSTLSKRLRQKWTFESLFFPKFLCFETELLWFPVSLNVESTGVSWSVCLSHVFVCH